jgi:ribosome recycling factor
MGSKELKADAKHRMDGAIHSVHEEFAKIRTGRATPALLDSVRVDYYGQKVPLSQVGNVSTPEPRMLVVQPWEKNLLSVIEKEIQKADLGLNPSNDGNIIRIPIPQLSEERRKDLVKLVHRYGEDGKVAIRNVRRDANDHLKKLEKNHEISEDELSVALEEIQNMTDEHIKLVEKISVDKEKEVLEV